MIRGRRGSKCVRFRGSIHVPEDEICLFTFHAPSDHEPALAGQQAGLDPFRIARAISSRKEKL
jgi:hypothetical protein